MNKYAITIITAILVFCLSSPMLMAHDRNTWSWSNGAQGINLDDGDAIIHGNDGTVARITSDGTLAIAGKTISVNAQQKQQLIQYVSTVKDIEIKGEQLGAAAGGFAASVIGDVFIALASGANEDDIDRKAEARANQFKKKALPICRDVQTLKQIQESLKAGILAFKPYAVIEGKDADDCAHDINSDD